MTTIRHPSAGRLLTDSEPPAITLKFYSYGCLMTRHLPDGGFMEYPVEPEAITRLLSQTISLSTGLLSPDTLLVKQMGEQRQVAAYRQPQRTGLYLEDSSDPLRVPLPGLVLIRTTQAGSHPNYQLYAVKRRPHSLNAALYRAPLPNIFTSGSICYGTVPMLSPDALAENNLEADFRLLFGSAFGSHSVSGKSRKYGEDIRRQLIALDASQAKRYPTSDLIEHKTTLASVLKES